MPFDPAWPQNGQNIDADRFRGQFAGIIDLIGSGSGINAAQVDSTNTLPPNTPANASVSLVGNTLHFTFEIPQGNDGPQGQQGNDGQTGPPFANAVVDSVNTLPPGSPATVGVSFDGSNVRFTFGIPQGNDGPAGATGQPGEVSLTDLNNGLLNNLSQCSNNTNNVSTLGQGADGSYNQSQMQDLINKVDELINALRR